MRFFKRSGDHYMNQLDKRREKYERCRRSDMWYTFPLYSLPDERLHRWEREYNKANKFFKHNNIVQRELEEHKKVLEEWKSERLAWRKFN